MPLDINEPPTMRVLLEDPIFAKMMRRNVQLPDNLVRPGMSPAWHVWVMTDSERWKRGRYHTYAEAYRMMRKQLEKPSVLDVSIVSVRYMFGPPEGFRWQPRKYPWCARCRRPSVWQERQVHRAVQFIVETDDDPLRCFYCGIRREGVPTHSPW